MAHGQPSIAPVGFDNLRLELRRGCLTIAALAALRAEQDGRLRKILAELLAEGQSIDNSLNGILSEPHHAVARPISERR
jgi:hypothetical protein